MMRKELYLVRYAIGGGHALITTTMAESRQEARDQAYGYLMALGRREEALAVRDGRYEVIAASSIK